jgi:hypothetical protein
LSETVTLEPTAVVPPFVFDHPPNVCPSLEIDNPVVVRLKLVLVVVL